MPAHVVCPKWDLKHSNIIYNNAKHIEELFTIFRILFVVAIKVQVIRTSHKTCTLP